MIEQSEWNSVKNYVENKLKCPKPGKNNNMSCVIKFNIDFFSVIINSRNIMPKCRYFC